MQKETNKALRFNEGKTRYDLLEPYAIEQLAKVFTKGSEKYEEHNWLKGMKWSKMLASLKRHLAAYEQGTDYDEESSLLHMAHVAWNAMGLVSYYKYHPELDDRLQMYKFEKRIGVDVDEVLADWANDWCRYWGTPEPCHWGFDREIHNRFTEMIENGTIDEFYTRLKPLIKAEELPFEPVAYITSRPVDSKITANWLDNHNFPSAKVHTVKDRKHKVQIAKELELDIFIDDNYQTFVEMNKAGICCFLMDHPHNRKFNVGYKRIKDFNDFKQRFL